MDSVSKWKTYVMSLNETLLDLDAKSPAEMLSSIAMKSDLIELIEMLLQSKSHTMSMSMIVWVSTSSRSKGVFPWHLVYSDNYRVSTMKDRRTTTPWSFYDHTSKRRATTPEFFFVFRFGPKFQGFLPVSCDGNHKSLTILCFDIHGNFSEGKVWTWS